MTGEVLESCASTNDLARARGLAGAAHGTWVSAKIQTAGRGRLGRPWESESGNLFLSIVLKPAQMIHWTWIPLLGAVSVVELLSTSFQQSLSGRRLSIKWPNDLWLDGRKLGGILCESVSSSGRDPFVILGLGLNCATAPEGLDQLTAALVGPELADHIRAPLAERIATNVLRLERDGPEWLRQSYNQVAAFPAGETIHWKNSDGNETGAITVATVLKLGDSGELWVQMSDGSNKALFAEEIRGLRSTSGESPA